MQNERLFLLLNTRLIFANYTVLQTMILLCSPVSLAADYQLQSSIALMTENDDNVRLQANINDIESLQGTSAIVNADFSRNEANRSLSINNRLASRQYDLNRYNSVDVSTTTNYQRSFERGSLSLNLSASDESIRSLENQLENDDSTEQRATKATSYSLAISGQRQLTERQFLQNQFSMQKRDYESKNRNSYDYFSNSLLWVYSINSVLSAQVNLSLSSFRPEETDGIEVAFIESARNDYGLNDFTILNRLQYCIGELDPLDPFNPDTALSLTAPIPNFQPPYNGIACFSGRSFSLKQDTVNFQLGLQYQWTENSSLNLLLGRTRSETKRDVFDPTNAILVTGELTGNYVQETEQYNLSYSADIDYRHSARITSKLSASQSQEQTAYGVSSYTRRLILSNNWRIKEFNRLNINISHVERNQSFTSTNQTLSDSTFSKLSISYMQQWTKYFSSNFSYIYGEIENNAPKSGKRNRFILTLTWQPKVFSWSK